MSRKIYEIDSVFNYVYRYFLILKRNSSRDLLFIIFGMFRSLRVDAKYIYFVNFLLIAHVFCRQNYKLH